MHSKNENITIGWCDNGMVDGKFTEGLMFTMLVNKGTITDTVRAQGNQIARQRQALLDEWYGENKTDWLLWVDSDIVLTPEVFKMLWDTADKVSKPVVTGTYFISKENEQSMMAPFPCLFTESVDDNNLRYVHPLPKNEVIKVDCAGMGLVLMHRSVVTKLYETFPGESVFAEIMNANTFIGEDIVFFRKLREAGVPVYAHTGATVKHMKRFALDEIYYNNFWQIQLLIAEQRKKDDRVSKLV
jgi:GT2 family glycosyltransferase